MSLRFVLTIAVFFTFSFEVSAEHKTRSIKIGAILPLTGDAASWGEAIQNGIELAWAKLPEDRRAEVEVLYEDDQRNPRLAVAAFRKLVELDHVVAVIGVTAQPGMAIAPLAEQYRVPFISIAVPKQISAGKKFTVMLYAKAERMAEAMATEAVGRGYRNIARVSSIHDGRFAMREAFDAAAAGRIKASIDEEYSIEIKDFRPFLSKIKRRKDIDAIYLNLVLGQAGLAAKQARELGLPQPLFESEMFEDQSEVDLSQGALVGQWFVNQADAPDTFAREYFTRFPKSKIFNASNGYDAFMLIVSAASDTSDPVMINSHIHDPKGYEGVMGRYTLGTDNRFDMPVAVKEVLPHGFRTLRVIGAVAPALQ